ncbi:CIR protein [Plasmodium chabaudi chabaudi]|uniref:CIR protein n=1 Tax=Plasmodium chabaudi chabaudi TaxID=31271 RepID=A0A4V0K7E8_PLACU|nr:CIR protein [Plasmodium chabaudi chabaudi]VTZ68998.1 CIR protein [Plasmodium chabaudi chabaudi]|eukprot:XP_016653894.1 CIR protein [Plasmodium chabaudi chabaudi]
MADKACTLLREVDAYFNNENVNEEKFNNSGLFTYRCPRKGKEYICTTNNERINTLGVYLYENLNKISKDFKGEGNEANRHIEIFMMWLSGKLYKLENNKSTTLEESYKKYLENNMPSFNYWNVLGSKREYKIANVWYMSRLYSLLECICSIVIEYGKSKRNKQIEQISQQCYQKFINIYKDVKECYSYFHLLKFLKNIYDVIRNDAINETVAKKKDIKNKLLTDNGIRKAFASHIKDSKQVLGNVLNALTISLKDLTPKDWDQRFLDESDQTIDLYTKNCNALHSEISKQAKKDISKNPSTEQSQSGSNKLETQQQAEAPTALPPPPEPQKQDSPTPPPPPEPQKQNSLSPSQPPEQPKDNQEKAPSPPAKESSQIQLPNSLQSQEQKLETNQEGSGKLSKDPPSNEKIPESPPSLPGGEKKEPENIKAPTPGGQNNDNPQAPTPGGQSNDDPQPPTPTQDLGSPDSKQVNHPDSSPEKQSQLPVDSSSKTANLGIMLKGPGITIEKKIPQLLKIKDIFKGYNRPETVITVILIPIITLIIYKYLSRERTKKSEKKNMKKVINLAYGKRKTQIIIQSCDRTKNLKPVINSVDRKKDSLLNIHKLMQADSIPFINLFFLLIFLSIKENTIFWNYKFN